MKYMKYELKDEYLIKDEKGEVMAVSLPVVGEITISTKALSLAKVSCEILKGKASGKIPCLLFRGGWISI